MVSYIGFTCYVNVVLDRLYKLISIMGKVLQELEKYTVLLYASITLASFTKYCRDLVSSGTGDMPIFHLIACWKNTFSKVLPSLLRVRRFYYIMSRTFVTHRKIFLMHKNLKHNLTSVCLVVRKFIIMIRFQGLCKL